MTTDTPESLQEIERLMEHACVCGRGVCKSCDNLRSAITRVVQEREESGWLIERGDSDPAAPKYWAAGQREAERTSAWTSNHEAAIRFARKQDAAAVAHRLFPSIAVRIACHGWENRTEKLEREVMELSAAVSETPALLEAVREKDARIAVLEKALKASPCTIDGFDRLVWDCKERDCLRCAALSTAER